MYGQHDVLYPSKWLRRQKEAGRESERQRETDSDKDSARARCEVETFADVEQGADAAFAARCPSTSRVFRRPPKRGVRISVPIRRPASPTLRASNRPPQRFSLENKEKPCKLHTPTRPQSHPPTLTHATTSVVCVTLCVCVCHLRRAHASVSCAQMLP